MKPTNLESVDPKTLKIEWDDGEVTYYPLDFLRRNCPCASCNEAKHQQSANINPLRVLKPHEIISNEMKLLQAQVVGRYALTFEWSDGHREGIYTFDFLRELAEDEICRKLKQEREG